jgi:hypothetical protein
MAEKSLGQVAYEAFFGDGFGSDLWADLTPERRKPWEDAGRAVGIAMMESEHEYKESKPCKWPHEGKHRAVCSCGWESAPVFSPDCVPLYAVHAERRS